MLKMIPADLPQKVFDQIDMGLDAYGHRTTFEVIGLPDDNMRDYLDEGDDWSTDIRKVEENLADYVAIEKLTTPEEIKMRQRFTWRVENEGMSDKLFNSLNGRGAFRRFRSILDRNPALLEQWYAYERNFKQRHVESLLGLRFGEEK